MAILVKSLEEGWWLGLQFRPAKLLFVYGKSSDKITAEPRQDCVVSPCRQSNGVPNITRNSPSEVETLEIDFVTERLFFYPVPRLYICPERHPGRTLVPRDPFTAALDFSDVLQRFS